MSETFHEYASNREALELVNAVNAARSPRAGLLTVLTLLRDQARGRFRDNNAWHWLDGLIEDVQ